MQAAWRSLCFGIKGYKHYGKAGYENASKNFNHHDLEGTREGISYMVTGANSGIGKLAALGLAEMGGSVHMLCRNPERGENARKEIVEQTGNENVELHIVDVSETEQVRNFVDSFISKKKVIHVLINNAGVLLDKRTKTEEGLDATFATNFLGGYLLSELFRDYLIECATAKGIRARIVNVSSGGMYTEKLNVDDIQFEKMNTWDGVKAYAQTKRAQVIYTERSAKKFSCKYPIDFFCMHPGWSDTPGVQKSLPSFHEKMRDRLRSEKQGADTIVWLAASQNEDMPKHTGEFFLDRTQQPTHLFLGGTQSTIDEVEEYFKKVDAVLSALRNADDSGDGGCSTENTDKNEETSIGRVEKRTKKKKNKSSPANVGEFKHEKETKGENKTNEATNQESSGNPEKEKSTAEEEK